METSVATRSSAPAWARTVGTAAAVLLGLILLVAAWAKAVDPESFVEQIRIEGLDFFGLAELVAYAAIVIEIALGTALTLGIRRRWVLIPTVLLVLFFLFLTGRTYWRFEHGLIDESESCGCFGNLVDRTPAQAFWQDLFLLGIPAILAFVGRPGGAQSSKTPSSPTYSFQKESFPTIRVAVVVAVTIAGLIFTIKAPSLPLDNLATRLRPGVEIADICAGAEGNVERLCLDTVVSELESGRHWVILSGLEEESFLTAMPELNAAAVSSGDASRDTGLWVVTTAVPEVVASFGWTQAPAFEVREAPPALVGPLHRRLPRSFLVEDGVVIETISGLPPTRGLPETEN
jgi:uncharacterized membrane protein YphA (DoxX/SURF4 family)